MELICELIKKEDPDADIPVIPQGLQDRAGYFVQQIRDHPDNRPPWLEKVAEKLARRLNLA